MKTRRASLGFPPRRMTGYRPPRPGDGGGGPPGNEYYTGTQNADQSSDAVHRNQTAQGYYPTFAEILMREHAEFLKRHQGDEALAVEEILKLTAERSASFLAAVRLDCVPGESLLIDTGAYDGLAGSEWFESHINSVSKLDSHT